MEYPAQWDIIVDILLVLLGLVQNDGWHEAIPSAQANTSYVHHNGARYIVCTLHIRSP